MGRKRSLGHLDVGSNCGRRVFLDAPMLDVFPYGYRADSTRAGLYQKRFSKCNGTGVFPQRGSNCKNFSGWWFGTFIYLGTIIPTDALIFFRGVGQPPTRNQIASGHVETTSSFHSNCQDLAVLTGAELITEELGGKLEDSLLRG
jgi:hypothetical protein